MLLRCLRAGSHGRHRLRLLAIAGLLSACAGGGGEAVTVSTAVLVAAKSAFQYGYPLTETMRVCDLAGTVNRLAFSASLATPQNRAVVTPNNDTLYGSACIWLGDGTVTIDMPPAQGRYQSLQVMDAFTNSTAIRGPRQIPSQGARYVLRLKGAATGALPANAEVIDLSTPYAYLLTRTLVDGPADLAAADAAQRGISLQASSSQVPVRPVAPSGLSTGQTFFTRLNQRLAQNPVPAGETALLASFGIAGVAPSLAALPVLASAEQLAAWDIAYREGLAALDSGTDVSPSSLGDTRNGWRFPGPALGDFGTDYAYRALVARKGLFALTRSEAVYLSTATEITGAVLDGRNNYVLRLPPDWPPVDARGFWSLTLYGTDNFLVANAIDRYSIGGRTPGLIREPDGSLFVYIQCVDPGGSRSANWLPAPCARFSLTMRLYLPNDAVLTPAFAPPALQRE